MAELVVLANYGWYGSMAKLVRKEFTSNGSWVAPSGVTTVLVVGYGGGGGGASGGGTTASQKAGGGGGGSLQSTVVLTVVPNTSYTITIGAGGTGATTNRTSGADGSSTIFGSLATFIGGGKGLQSSDNRYSAGGLSVSGYNGAGAALYRSGADLFHVNGPGYGGCSAAYTDSWKCNPADSNPLGYAGGTAGTTSGSYPGGGGGGGGPGGVGGSGGGGGGDSGGVGVAGTAAAANTGAGGGGGGSGSGGAGGGVGGNGGSGKLTIIWVE